MIASIKSSKSLLIFQSMGSIIDWDMLKISKYNCRFVYYSIMFENRTPLPFINYFIFFYSNFFIMFSLLFLRVLIRWLHWFCPTLHLFISSPSSSSRLLFEIKSLILLYKMGIPPNHEQHNPLRYKWFLSSQSQSHLWRPVREHTSQFNLY